MVTKEELENGLKQIVNEQGEKLQREEVEWLASNWGEFQNEVELLVKERGGKFHRDDGIERITSNTAFTEEEAAILLEYFIDFDERGITYLTDAKVQDVSSFSGDISSLSLTPGRITEDTYHGLRILEQIEGGHPLIPQEQEDYFDRKLPDASATDVEVLCQAMADSDFNPLLVGEAGTGKDTLIRHVCARTNRPVVRVNFGSDVRYEDLVGMHTLSDEGEMVWRDGYLTAAVRYGWVFVADEINAAPAESTMPLHQVTEERGKASLMIREKSEVVEPHPQFRFIGTMNPPTGGYGGTNELNDAFKSRFYMIEIDYLDEQREADLVDDKINADEEIVARKQIEDLCELAHKLRNHLEQSHIETPYTTREILKTCKLSTMMPVEEAAKVVFLGHASENDEKMIRDMIEKVL